MKHVYGIEFTVGIEFETESELTKEQQEEYVNNNWSDIIAEARDILPESNYYRLYEYIAPGQIVLESDY